MRVKIFDVRVPDSTTRFFQVPVYDVPIIRRMWHGRLKPDAYGNRAELQVVDMGVIEGRSLHSEKLRIRRDWSTSPDGSKLPAWQEIYPTDADFQRVWQAAVDACSAEEASLASAAPRHDPEPELVGASTASSASLFSPPPEAPRRRGGRPKKQ